MLYSVLPWRRNTFSTISKDVSCWCKDKTNEVVVYCTHKKAFRRERENENERKKMGWNVSMRNKFPVSFPLFASIWGQKPESIRHSGKGHSVIYTINRNKPDFHTWQSFNSWIKLLYFNLNCVKQISLLLLFLTFIWRLNELRLFLKPSELPLFLKDTQAEQLAFLTRNT